MSASIDAQLLQTATQYVSWEPNAKSRQAVQSMIDSGDAKSLKDAFEPRIAFGTAGLRARMSHGYHNMCELVILQTSQGFARYIESVQGEEAKSKGIVLGYDGRHNSRTYAEITAGVFLSAGFKVHLFSRMCGTPFVPYGVLQLNACAGIMITASHNPKDDNGYKVYWSNGAQIIPPHDSGIAASIEKNMKPWHLKDGDQPSAPAFDPNHPNLSDPFDSITNNYFEDAARDYCWRRDYNRGLTQSQCPVTFTAMHGVGAPFTAKAFEVFGLPKYIPTPQQIEADPEFPTVKFPNPEEVRKREISSSTGEPNACTSSHADPVVGLSFCVSLVSFFLILTPIVF